MRNGTDMGLKCGTDMGIKCVILSFFRLFFTFLYQHITYPDPGNPGHYINVFKTPTTLNDGQQQPVDNFPPRANLKCFFKDGAI
jgi:hypothetical protein